MKKRNCRKTAREKQQHERAVAIRKMTDEQLCKYIDDIISSVPKTPEVEPSVVIEAFINQLEEINTPGKKLSKQTIQKIRSLAVDMDYLS
ncbi:MAG: hypothetical protein LUE11_04905 [Clostridia bacterium]|nr:hypothetical protein [Clostridia bacterium]